MLDVCLVYGGNEQHTYLFRWIDLDHEGDLEVRRSPVVGLVESLILKVEKPIVFYDTFYIQKYGSKENSEDMLTNSLPRDKLKLSLELVDLCRS